MTETTTNSTNAATNSGSAATSTKAMGTAPAGAPFLLGKAIEANELRALAEATDGIRNAPAYLCESSVDPKHPYKVSDKKNANGEFVLEFLTTDKVDPGRGTVTLCTKQDLYNEDGSKFKPEECDAIFTSLAAVEKFLVPYYARMRHLDDVKDMRDRFESSPFMVAAFHLPSSLEGRAIADGGMRFARADKQGVVQVMSFDSFIAK